MTLRIFPFLLLIITMLACGTKQNPSDSNKADTTVSQTSNYNGPKELVALYRHADSLVQIGEIDTKMMQTFVDNATKYAEEHPNDTLSPHFMLYAGIFEMDIALSTPSESKRNKRFFQSIDIFNKLTETYPQYKNIPYCYYYKGQIYENMRRNSDAENEYRKLVHQFPDSDLGKNIAEYLKVRGFEKSSDEIMHEIGKK